MYSENEVWVRERERVAARQARLDRKKERLAQIEDLPRFSQRIVGRFLEWFRK